ncbi:hypothetical protein [Paractinoplanes rishiriensis]|uniref:Uncharacterized protein n=1 Tax=Paractinoplanes rishiriensis TaxID=1050105 RepID=A0A919K0U8_9ACTN|nr:hypothetical protein [Actinoplanes rishiriensis]GIE97334.1 hypothetical protein Ari01nite_47990 [Actinoplanes rishiriensis]
MQLTHVAMAAAVTVSVAGVSYAALNQGDAEKRAREVASRATCRSVDAAITAYVAVYAEPPKRITELTGWVKGDISAYRIVNGVAAGPGC